MKTSVLTGACALMLVMAAGSASAAPPIPAGPPGGQALERNLPPPPSASQSAIAPPTIAAGSADATPIGPALKGLVLLAPKDGILTDPAVVGVDTSRVARMGRHARVLRRFIGQTLSRKLIAEIEATIAIAYRGDGYPFVRLSTPPQELTQGVLQIRVDEFDVGKILVSGVKGAGAAYVTRGVRLKAGEPVNAPRLAEDLDWLNRYPFEQVTAVFTPSVTPGETDLSLQTVKTKPWSAYVGYADSGSPLTGFDRYILGAQAALPGLIGGFVSYQYTGSDDALFSHQTLFQGAPNPKYVSHAGRILIPTLARQDIELSADYIETYTPIGQGLATRLTDVEADVAYRATLSDLVSSLPGEAVLGINGKSEITHTLFAGQPVVAQAITVFEANFGWTFQETDYLGHTAADATLHISPGGIGQRNTAAAYAAFSSGGFSNAQFAYINGDVTRSTHLPTLFGVKGLSVTTTVIGQYAPNPLPFSDKSGFGGPSLVRGYNLDDGAFDSAIVSRNELHASAFSFIYPKCVFSPYIFFDYGYGYDHFNRINSNADSTGLGLDIQLGPHLSAGLDGAFALSHAGGTKAGDAMIDSRITVRF